MKEPAAVADNTAIKRPPTGLAVFALVGPAFVWCAEFIGSGEVILATRTGAILDHPENVGYPTYWHARDYGLFSANPLGQKIFSEGQEELNFALGDGESTTFRYRLALYSGKVSPEDMESRYQAFIAKVQ